MTDELFKGIEHKRFIDCLRKVGLEEWEGYEKALYLYVDQDLINKTTKELYELLIPPDNCQKQYVEGVIRGVLEKMLTRVKANTLQTTTWYP